jgi:hypothetical protein
MAKTFLSPSSLIIKEEVMVRAKAKKQILSLNEIGGLNEERAELERSLRDGEGFGAGTAGASVDTSPIKKQIARLNNEIVDGSPGKLTGSQKDSLHREANELKEQFKLGLPTRYEMAHPAKCPGAVRKHMKWLNENEKTGLIARFVQIQRLINPGEEESIETLRKDK